MMRDYDRAAHEYFRRMHATRVVWLCDVVGRRAIYHAAPRSVISATRIYTCCVLPHLDVGEPLNVVEVGLLIERSYKDGMTRCARCGLAVYAADAIREQEIADAELAPSVSRAKR